MPIPVRLLAWYKRHGRVLPWRETREPYRILVSEVMLQQTQVARVIDYYDRWLQQFPDWQTLAQASTHQVIHVWSGLGYNRRGLMLRSIAQYIATHGEPTTEESWRALKGIGPYTAAALAAFAFKQRTLPIDTNIRRVLGRVFLGRFFPDPTVDERIRGFIDEILPKQGEYYNIPQALFDLATSICTKSPQCAACPLKSQCKSADAFLRGAVETPKRTIKKANETIHPGKKYPDRIYRGRILKAIKDTANGLTFAEIAAAILPDGTTIPFERCLRPDTVAVIAFLDEHTVLLNEERPIDQDTPFFDVPGGRIDAGESDEHAAARELREETGYVADRFLAWETTSYRGLITFRHALYVAKGLRPAAAKLNISHDPTEHITTRSVSFEEVYQKSLRGEIRRSEVMLTILRMRHDETSRQRLADFLKT